MTDGGLQDARVRLVRAREHFQAVEREWAAIPVESKTIALRSEYKPDLKKIEVLIDSIPDMPTHWSIICSECLFNVRASLDYVAWYLACWNLNRNGETREPIPQTQFPIFTNEQAFNPGWVKDMHPSHVALIKWLQPYSPIQMPNYAVEIISRGGDAEALAKGHVIERFRSTHNHDKHRLIQLAAMAPHHAVMGSFDAVGCEVTNPNWFGQADAFEKDAKWAEFDVVSVSSPNPRVDVPVEITPALRYGSLKILLEFPLIEAYVLSVIEVFERGVTQPHLGAPP